MTKEEAKSKIDRWPSWNIVEDTIVMELDAVAKLIEKENR